MNTNNLNYVPIISDYSGDSYMTRKTFLHKVIDFKSFQVLDTSLDTSNRSFQSSTFTAIVVGIHNNP